MSEQPIILFDGVCNFCNGSVNFIIRHDPSARFRFAPLQSAAGQRLARECGLHASVLDTVVLIEHGRAYRRSTAALRIARGLSGAYWLIYALILLPSFVRDWSYDWFARNRYQWFGKRRECMLPGPEVRARFLVD